MHLFHRFPAMTVAVAVLWVMIAPSPATAADPSPPLMNAMCPVMPEMEADPQHFIDHEGQRIYFCCPSCAPKFKGNPAAYLDNLPEATISLAAILQTLPSATTGTDATSERVTGPDSPTLTNTTCPVMPGEPVDPAIFVEHEGRRVYMCCDLCVDRFKANPARYADEVARVMPALQPASGAEEGHPHGDEGADDHERTDAAAIDDPDDHGGHGHSEHGHETEARLNGGAEQTTNAAIANGQHDHSAHEHDETRNSLFQFIGWLGRFHPPAVAFPIALLAAAGVAELMFVAKKQPIFDHASRFCVWFGIAMTVTGGILGWFFAGFRLTDPTWLLTTHRWLGTTATLWALLLIVPTVKVWGSENACRWRLWYRLALLVAILLVGTNAFFGGAMIYGLDHYQWPS